jgi:predicted exporter
LLRVLDAQGATAPATVDGVWVDPGPRIAVLLALTHAPGFDIDAQAAAMDAVRAAYRAVLAERQPGPALTPPLELLMTGPGVFAVESRAAIRQDASRLSALATGLIIVLLWLTLRSVRFLVLAAVPVVSGVLIGLAAVAVRYGSIHGITLGFGITLIGEAVDYAVYVHLQRVAGRVDRRLGRALGLAAATSAAGFIAMLCSGFAGLEQLGLFSLVGIVVAALVAGVLLPGALPGPRLHWLPVILTAPPAALRRWRMPLLALSVALAAAVVGAAALRNGALWSDALGQVSPLAPERGDLDGQLRDALALPDLRWLVAIGAEDQDIALARAEDLAALLERLQDAGAIGGYDSPARLLPSLRTQQARRAALPAPDELRRRMRLAIDGTPFDPEAFEPFIDAIARARDAPPVTAASFNGTLLGARLAAQLVDRPGRSTVLIALRAVTDPSRLAAALQPYAPQVELIDLKDNLEHLITDYRGRALRAAAAGVLAIVVLLAWRLRDPLAAARIALALMAAVVITAAIVLLGGGHLTLFHVVAMLLVVGVGSNYGLFLCQLSPDPQLRRATIASVLLCAGSTTVGFGILAFAATPVLHMIGLTVGVGALVALLTTAALATGDARQPRASTEVPR